MNDAPPMSLSTLFWKLFLHSKGWHIEQNFPHHLPQAVILVAPHTSGWDFVYGLAVRSVLRLDRVHFLGKKELFDGPFGWWFRWLGGTPVDRFSKQGMVEQVVTLLKEHPHWMIALSPEGTRKKVEKLRTGFYHIALQANIPVVFAALDYGKKRIYFSEPKWMGEDIEEEIRQVVSWFATVKGKFPEKGI